MDNLAKDFFNNIKKNTIEYNNLEDVLYSNEHMSNFNEQLHVALFVVNHIIKSQLEARMKPSSESLQQEYKTNTKQNIPNRWELVTPNFVDLKSKSAKLAFLIVCCKSKFNPKTVAEYTNLIDSFQSVNEVILYISGSRLSVDNKPLSEDSTKSLVSALLRLSDYEKDIYFSKTAYNINREMYMDRIQKMTLNQVTPFTPLILEYISGCVPKLDQFDEKKKRIDQLSVDRKGSVAAMIRELDEKIPKKRRSKFIDDAEYEYFVGDLHFPNDLVAHNGMSETTYYYKGCVFDVINQANMSLSWSERLKTTTDPKIELSKATGREICEISTNKSSTIAVSHKQNGEYIKEFITIRRKTLGS